MKRLIIILSIAFQVSGLFGQINKSGCALPTLSDSKIVYIFENTITSDIEYYKIDTLIIKQIFVIKDKELTNTYGNPKGGTVQIIIKPEVLINLKLQDILRDSIINLQDVKYYDKGFISNREKCLNNKVKELKEINFDKADNKLIAIKID